MSQTKICSKCKIEKKKDLFYINKRYKDGLRTACKDCDKEYRIKNSEKIKIKLKELNKKYRLENRDIIKNYREENKDKHKEYKKKYNIINAEKIKIYKKNYYDTYKNEIKKQNKIYEKENYNKIKERRHRYKILNKEKIKEQNKNYNKKNKEERKKKRNLYVKNKKNINPLFKLSQTIRVIINGSLKRKGYTKKSRTHKILGCSFEEFKLYLEHKFESWMNWNNHGLYNGELNYGWDIDHIIPVSIGKTEEEIIKLNHYTNLQPLCSKVNRDIKKDININFT